MTDPNALADRYVAVWNEADADRRRQMVAELWTEDGLHTLQPPIEMKEIASRPGLEMTARLEARGHDELAIRVSAAYAMFIQSGEYSFRRHDDAERVADAVKFRWEMVSASGEVAGVGLEFLVLAGDGRIVRDYQFIEA